MKKFCESLKGQVDNIIDFEKKKMLLLTKKEFKSHQDAKICFICRKRTLLILNIIKKLEIIVIIQVNQEALHKVYVI